MARKTTTKTETIPTDLTEHIDLGALFKGTPFSLLKDATWSNIDDRLPLGLPAIDSLLLGGLPFSRFAEVYSPENVGKSTLAVQATKMALDMMRVIVIWFDVEGTTDNETMVAKRVDTSRVMIRQPDGGDKKDLLGAMSIEGVGESVEELLKVFDERAPNVPVLLIWDSIGQTSSRHELDETFDSQRMGLQAKAITKLIKKIAPKITSRNVLFIGLNQARDKIGGMPTFGPQIESTGGRALRHYASVRFELGKKAPLQTKVTGGMEYHGHTVVAKLKKSKISKPNTRAEVFLFGQYGMDTAVNAIYEANKLKIISGSKEGNSELKYITNDGEIIQMKRLDFYMWSMADENFPIMKEIFTKVLLVHFPEWYPPLDNKTVNIELSPWYKGLREVYTALGKSAENLTVDVSTFDKDDEGDFNEDE